VKDRLYKAYLRVKLMFPAYLHKFHEHQ